MEIAKIAIEKINPAPYNPRQDLKPGDPDYEKLRKSLEEFDCVEPLVWNKRTGHLVGGHQRLKVLKARGDREVMVSVVDLPLDKEKALNLALNKIQGDWDMPKLKNLLEELDTGAFDIEITGFDEEEIEDLMTQYGTPPTEEESAEDDFDAKEALEQIATPRIQLGEVWQLGDHRLICGDAKDSAIWNKLLGGQLADLVVTSPPYNVGVKYRSYKDKTAKDEYLGLIETVALNVVKHLSPGRFVAWNVGVSPESYPHYHVVILESCGLEFYRQIVWEKAGVPYPIFQTTRRAKKARHYKPNYKHEMVYIFQGPGEPDLAEAKDIETDCPLCEGSGKVFGYQVPIAHEMILLCTKDEPELGEKVAPNNRYANDVWKITQSMATVDLPTLGTKCTGLEKNGKKSHMVKAHPAAYPVELPRALMGFLTGEGECVVDPFCGVGTTIVAAEKMGRRAYGIELDPLYCELAIMRWEKLAGKQAVRVDG